MNSVYNCYLMLLYIDDSAVKELVDSYNAGTLRNDAMVIALEILEGLPDDD